MLYIYLPGKADIEELNMKIGTLSEKIEQLKMESKTFLDNRYVQFKVQLNENHNMEIKLQALVGTMEQLNSRIETETKPELQNSTGELKSLSTQLQEMNAKLHIIKQLVGIDQMLNLAKQELCSQHYFKVAQILCDVRQMLKPVKDQDNPDILTGLKREAVFRGEAFLYELNNIWRDSVACEAEHNDTEEYVIRIDISNQTSFGELLQALYLYDELDLKLKLFSEKLTENVMLVLMQKQCVVRVEDSGGLLVMRVCVEGQDKNTPVTVINNMERVFFCLSNVLDMTVNPSDGMTFMNLLGKLMADDFCDLFIKEILRPAIPCTNEQRLAYDAVVEHTTKLQNYLQSIGFLNGVNQSLLDYAKNVDVHFANKQCEMTMSEARSIMKKDLHDSIEVSPQVSTSLGLTDDSTMDSGHTDSLESYASLSSSTLAFPKCVISKSVVELLALLQNLLKECSSSSELRAVRLYCTARKIIEMYCAITPVHHKKFLDTLPQQAVHQSCMHSLQTKGALLHNNCMYLAHQLLLLGPEFHEQLCQVMPSQSLTFIDLTCKLRQTGSQAFLGQMQVQKKQLFEILRDSGLSNLGEGDRLSVNTEKCIRQCLRQLELLQRVWQNVLPSNVYNKAIVNCSLQTAMCVSQLMYAFSMSQETGEVHHYVKRWRTLQELVLVLGANLQGIDDRWADGKGPLAYEFRPDQVKQLVRALFQNTARRAAVLSKIK
ncbi:hypothetical protein B566_EDAN011894 [Ephemera danica]|nr:hypothetical protein B566_EDAN011894 [Ephemera danica]